MTERDQRRILSAARVYRLACRHSADTEDLRWLLSRYRDLGRVVRLALYGAALAAFLVGCSTEERSIFVNAPAPDTVYVPAPSDTVREPCVCPPGWERHHGKCRKRHH